MKDVFPGECTKHLTPVMLSRELHHQSLVLGPFETLLRNSPQASETSEFKSGNSFDQQLGKRRRQFVSSKDPCYPTQEEEPECDVQHSPSASVYQHLFDDVV